MAPAAPTAAPLPLPALLDSLTTSLSTALDSLPNPSKFLPPPNGISLLDLKNESLLSYLHALSALILLRLRSAKGAEKNDIASCVEQLVELRAMLEKGVKPVEGKLRYQIDKVVMRSLEAEMGPLVAVNGKAALNANDEDESSSSSEEDEGNGKDEDEEGEQEEQVTKIKTTLPINLAHDVDGEPVKPKLPLLAPTTTLTEDFFSRPNPFALSKPASSSATSTGRSAPSDGVYRPPRISATAMPTATTTTSDPLAPPTALPRISKKSHSLDAFIASELSSAPLAEPSIGSTIAPSGRLKTVQARREEAERREYEETNFVRLPKPSKKELRKQRARDAKLGVDTFGGEDWRSFANDLDRLTTTVGGSKSSGGRRALEKSRKRGADEDADAGAGPVHIGRRFGRVLGRENSRKKRKT
ncbi:hypothetical protein BDZ91DRAFT_710654 [Kalaharituber pfeilii]|nr:hypothetical protein BDZ91DRAFT_710654 [Kalaharituber pfeilii]